MRVQQTRARTGVKMVMGQTLRWNSAYVVDPVAEPPAGFGQNDDPRDHRRISLALAARLIPPRFDKTNPGADELVIEIVRPLVEQADFARGAALFNPGAVIEADVRTARGSARPDVYIPRISQYGKRFRRFRQVRFKSVAAGAYF